MTWQLPTEVDPGLGLGLPDCACCLHPAEWHRMAEVGGWLFAPYGCLGEEVDNGETVGRCVCPDYLERVDLEAVSQPPAPGPGDPQIRTYPHRLTPVDLIALSVFAAAVAAAFAVGFRW